MNHAELLLKRIFPVGRCFVAILLVATFASFANAQPESTEDNPLRSTPGFPSTIKAMIIHGPEIVAKPLDDRAAAIEVEILETYAHGDDFRYDIKFTGYDPGKHNLAEYLKRKDNSTDPIERIEVEIYSVLPEGQVEPNERPQNDARFNSFYLATLLVGGAVWLLGLFAILFAGRAKAFFPSREKKIITVADRLRPMLEKAQSGELSTAEQAEIERLLIAFWRKKLRLSHLSASDMMQKLRGHNEAGVMLNQIEKWLHAPDTGKVVDVAALLAPYAQTSEQDI